MIHRIWNKVKEVCNSSRHNNESMRQIEVSSKSLKTSNCQLKECGKRLRELIAEGNIKA